MGDAVMWYSWTSAELFNAWHSDTCALLGLPRPGRNVFTGEIQADAEWTSSYTVAYVVSDTDIRAFVEDEVASLSPNMLGLPSESPPISSYILGGVTL